MAENGGNSADNPARQTLRDDDDEPLESLVRGGEGVRPLTAHTPQSENERAEDEQSRAPTMQMPAFSSSETPSEMQRVVAREQIELATASFTPESGRPSVSASGLARADDANATVVDGSRPAIASDATSAERKTLNEGARKPPRPRPRRREPRDESGPATIQVPVMTPSRLAELPDDAASAVAIPEVHAGSNPTATSSPAPSNPAKAEAPARKKNSAPPSSKFAAATVRAAIVPLDLEAETDGHDESTDAPVEDPTRQVNPYSATDLAEGPTESESEPLAPEWDEDTAAAPAQHLMRGAVLPGLPGRASPRIATMAPVADLSAEQPAVEVKSAPAKKRTKKKAGGNAKSLSVSAPPAPRENLPPPPVSTEKLPAVESSNFRSPGAESSNSRSPGAESSNSRSPGAESSSSRSPGAKSLSSRSTGAGVEPSPKNEVAPVAENRGQGTDHMGTPDAGSSPVVPAAAPAAGRKQPPPPPKSTMHDADEVEGAASGQIQAEAPPAARSEQTEARVQAQAAIAAAAADLATSDVPEVPSQIGPYVIDSLLDQGGMAEVFRASHPSKGAVVLKRMRPALLIEKRYVEMFLREAQIATTLHHDNIVLTLDYGAASGSHYLVMEELVGMSLRDLADRMWEAGKTLPLEVVLRTAADAARGLHHAHTVGDLVHRDVSPDNVFVTCAGTTKMLDFGIAKQPDSERLTRTGEIKGKVPFMSPEHILGDPPVSGKSDIWSLAVTTYWLMCGTRPFDAATDVMTLQAVVESRQAPVSQRNAEIPRDVSTLIDKALQKRPGHRFATAEEFADALDAAARALVPDEDDAAARLELDRLVTQTLAEANTCPLPEHPARAPYPPCASHFRPRDDGVIAGASAGTATAKLPRRSGGMWLMAGLAVGVLATLALSAFVIVEFVLPKVIGGGP